MYKKEEGKLDVFGFVKDGFMEYTNLKLKLHVRIFQSDVDFYEITDVDTMEIKLIQRFPTFHEFEKYFEKTYK